MNNETNSRRDSIYLSTAKNITIISEEAEETKKSEKCFFVMVKIFLKIIGLLTCLYVFVISLNLMSISFPLIGGRYASEAFRSNVVLTNPFAGLMIGLLSTVIIQSSSTSTSIVVSMVASEIIPVRLAIPIIMGTNIGTSVTSTFVSLGQASDKEKFRLSFAGATIHDMFNILSVSTLLPFELATGYLEKFSSLLVGPLNQNANPNAKEPEMLNAITKPLTDAIIQIDKSVLDKIATNQSTDSDRLIKKLCKKKLIMNDHNNENSQSSQIQEFINELSHQNDSDVIFINHDQEYYPCKFLFANVDWPEWVIGLLLLTLSIMALSTCLVMVVKLLGSIFKGPVAKLIQKTVNSDLPGVFKYFTGFVAIMLGCALTIIVQSSSVFTSTLTPLVGMGIVTVERVFPLTLGSNIGTTVTGILASLSGPTKTLKSSLQIALCHTLFNVTGIIVWYPIPYLRKVPLDMARFLGNTTAEYRWFALAYIIGVFFIFPIIIFSLSLLGRAVFLVILIIVILVGLSLILINILQKKKPNLLPEILKNWEFLPIYLRSLRPYDDLVKKYLCFCECCRSIIKDQQEEQQEPPETIEIQHLSNEPNNNHQKIVIYTNKAYVSDRF